MPGRRSRAGPAQRGKKQPAATVGVSWVLLRQVMRNPKSLAASLPACQALLLIETMPEGAVARSGEEVEAPAGPAYDRGISRQLSAEIFQCQPAPFEVACQTAWSVPCTKTSSGTAPLVATALGVPMIWPPTFSHEPEPVA